MNWPGLQAGLAERGPFRSLVGIVFRSWARRRLAVWDHQDPARAQLRALQELLRRARATRFGRDHDFARVRSPRDFRRLVPLRRPGDLWQHYWQPAFPNLGGLTWPGPVQALALSHDPRSPYVPLTPGLLASHRLAVLTGLALVHRARRRERPIHGRMLLVGDAPPPVAAGGPGPAGDLEDLLGHTLPPWLRPLLLDPPAAESSPATPDERLLALVHRAVRMPLTVIAGRVPVLHRFFELCLYETGWRRLLDIWPRLTAVLYQRELGQPGAAPGALRTDWFGERSQGPPVLPLEMYWLPEACLAIEDPRYGYLRMLTDHGVYFEFLQPGEEHSPRPRRLGLADLQVGSPYGLVVSSPAGIWSCWTGIRVAFRSLWPPLLDALTLALAAPVAHAGVDQESPARLRSGGTAAARPGTSGRSAWSAPAGPG